MTVRFKGCAWVGSISANGDKVVRNGDPRAHWTASYWMSAEGELFCELPCEGNRVVEYLPRAVWKWLVSE